MALKLANRMNGLRTSEIREILKLTQKPSVISFAGGLPAVESFPCRELADVSTRVLEEHGKQVLQYSPTEGVPALREAIAERMNRNLKTRRRAVRDSRHQRFSAGARPDRKDLPRRG